jgi:predicted RecB family nuclease
MDAIKGEDLSSHLLTKSTFLRGLQCPKSLMLDVLHPELRDPLDPQAQLRMRLGQEVGMLARDRYPGGEISRIPGAIEPSLERTQSLIKAGARVLYEPAFQHNGVFILVDVLVKGANGWRLIEVKSTSRTKEHHLWDVAVQLYVLRGVGFEIEDAALLHMNSDYMRQGELDLLALFTETSLLTEVEQLQDRVEHSVADSSALLVSGKVPVRDIGPYCKDPEECDFIGHCWAHLPQPSIFNVYRLTTKKKFELYQAGITQIEDIPTTFQMPSSSSFHAEAYKAGAPIVKRSELLAFVEGLNYPLYFLDFETFSVPIPPFDRISPYTHVPFQYSLHVQDHPGAEAKHIGYLAVAGSDPRIDFLDQLLRETEGSGDLIVYNVSFERNVLRDLAEQFPRYAEEVQMRIERLVDLMEPFRQRLYWKPEMGGSVSLKAVLPALVPDLSYDELEVQDGTQAMQVYLGLEDLGDSGAAEAQRQALWAYCELDTLAMVRILEALGEVLQ